MDMHTLLMVAACLFVIAEGAIVGFVYMLGFHKGQHFERTHFSHTPNRPAQPPTMPKGQ